MMDQSGLLLVIPEVGVPSENPVPGPPWHWPSGTETSHSRVPCQNMNICDINLTHNGKEGPAISECINILSPYFPGKFCPPLVPSLLNLISNA